MTPKQMEGVFCRWIWSQVLQTAIEDAQARFERRDYNDQARAALRLDAQRWIDSERTGIGSFRWVCLQLDLDPGRVRQQVTRGTEPPRKAVRRNFNGYPMDDSDGLGFELDMQARVSVRLPGSAAAFA